MLIEEHLADRCFNFFFDRYNTLIDDWVIALIFSYEILGLNFNVQNSRYGIKIF